jgi:hypothetical protein
MSSNVDNEFVLAQNRKQVLVAVEGFTQTELLAVKALAEERLERIMGRSGFYPSYDYAAHEMQATLRSLLAKLVMVNLDEPVNTGADST